VSDVDVETRARIKLNGQVDIGTPWFTARFAGLEIKREGPTWRMRFDGAIDEIRKFAAVDARYAAIVAFQNEAPADAHGTLTVTAPPPLAADLAREEAASQTPQEWLSREPFAALVIALDRWEPESSGIVTSE